MGDFFLSALLFVEDCTVALTGMIDGSCSIDWVVAGVESGIAAKATPATPANATPRIKAFLTFNIKSPLSRR